MCVYRHGGYDSIKQMRAVSQEMVVLEQETGLSVQNRLFYFAIPPNVFIPTGRTVKEAAYSTRGWNRVVVEKPFGHDLPSFNEMSLGMNAIFPEEEIYRIDHYLGKEMVQNLLVLRFANVNFEPVWNSHHISSVVITFKEDIGTQGRGGYFDSYGIIRDVMQNHLLQVLSLVAMEPPVRCAGGQLCRPRSRRKRSSSFVASSQSRLTTRFSVNTLATRPKKGTSRTRRCRKGSVTPTFATTVLRIKNTRWDGVPFIMKAGKALNERKAEVRIQFKPAPGASHMFPNIDIPRNELVLRLQPQEAMYMKTNVKSPGLNTVAVSSELDLTYHERYVQIMYYADTIRNDRRYADTHMPEAYTRLILDVLHGKQAAFVRDDELRAAWEIFTPLLHKIEEEKIKPLPYAFGSRGPPESDALVEKNGFVYHQGEYTWAKSRSSSNL